MKKNLNMVYLGVFLCIVCAAATAVMAYAASVTAPQREQAHLRKLTEGLRSVLPPFDNDILSTKQILPVSKKSGAVVYTAKKDGRIAGYAVETSSKAGYGGTITGLVSFSPDGTIYSFIVTDHTETPGLGGEVAERKEMKSLSTLFSSGKAEKKVFPHHLPPNKVLDQFTGLSFKASPWKLKSAGGTIDGISGATVTSRAVTSLVSKAAKVFTMNPDKFPFVSKQKKMEKAEVVK